MKLRVGVWCVLVSAGVGCGGPHLTWRQKMDSSAGVERMQGVMQVAEDRNWSALPLVIERLEDDDESVRLMASRVLHEMTGEDFGYQAYAPEHERREAAARWRNWWNTTGRHGKRTSPPGTGGSS